MEQRLELWNLLSSSEVKCWYIGWLTASFLFMMIEVLQLVGCKGTDNLFAHCRLINTANPLTQSGTLSVMSLAEPWSGKWKHVPNRLQQS